jgi:Flp pilus assembly protein TadG
MKAASIRGTSLRKPARQRGAAALEFALLFSFFVAILYGIISYALAMLIQQGLTQAAAEAARSAVRLDQLSFTNAADYEAAVAAIVKDTAVKTVEWMPKKAKDKVSAAGSVTTSWVSSSRTVTTGGNPLTINMRTLTVRVTYPGYAADPLIHTFNLPGIGPVPVVPTDLVGQSSIQLQL